MEFELALIKYPSKIGILDLQVHKIKEQWEKEMFPDINNKVKNLNNGGCGYFTLKLYERLDKDAYRLVNINHGRHIVILENFTGYFIDSRGYHDTLSLELTCLGENSFSFISEDNLRKQVNNYKIWNPDFNRNDTIIINDYIDKL